MSEKKQRPVINKQDFEQDRYKGYLGKIMEKVESLPRMRQSLSCSALDGVPTYFADSLAHHHVSFFCITDKIDGILFFTSKRDYAVNSVYLNAHDFVILEVKLTGIIFPPQSERDGKWLLCCCSHENWVAVQTELKKSLSHFDGRKAVWRSLEVNAIQIDRKKVRCPENMLFKISRLHKGFGGR